MNTLRVIRSYLGGVQLIFAGHKVLQIEHVIILVTISRINGWKTLQFHILECGVGFLIRIVTDGADLVKVFICEKYICVFC